LKIIRLALAFLCSLATMIPFAQADDIPVRGLPRSAKNQPPVVMEQLPGKAEFAPPVPVAPNDVDPQGRAPIPLTLDDSIRTAIEQSTTTLKSTNEVQFAGERLLQGYTQFLPNLVTNASYSYEKGRDLLTEEGPTVVQSTNYGPSYSISTTLNLFNGLADINALHSAIEKKNASELTLERARDLISLDVAQSYLQVILDEDIVEIAEKNLAASRARQRLLQGQTTVGVRNLSDLFRQQAETSSDELYLSNSQNRKRIDELRLIQKLRLDEERNYTLAVPILRTPQTVGAFTTDEKKLIDTALGRRQDLQAAAATTTAANHDVAVARAPYFPRLDLQFGLIGDARHYSDLDVKGVNSLPPSQPSIYSQLGNQMYGTVVLNLTWEIFSRGVTREAVANARLTADNLEIDEVDRQKQVVSDVRQAMGNYRTSLEQLDSTQAGLTAAQKAYQVMEGRYEVGASSFIDLITAQAALVQAQSARAQSVIGYELQIRGLETAVGTKLTAKELTP
jgi:outer membrane protein